MAKKQNNLNVTNLRKKSSELNKRETVYIGEDKMALEIDLHFRKSKINKLIVEILTNFVSHRESSNLGDVFVPYTMLMMIKHFTSLQISDELSQQLEVLDILVDLDYINEILDKLPQAEVQKVYDAIEDTTRKAQDNKDEIARMIAELEDSIENEEVQEQLVDSAKE